MLPKTVLVVNFGSADMATENKPVLWLTFTRHTGVGDVHPRLS